MSIRLGYACINGTLQKTDKVQCNRGMIKRTFKARGPEYAGELALSNVQNMFKIIAWNAAHGIEVYRMTSCLFPWMSEYEITELSQFQKIKSALELCGNYAVENNQRLSFHPGQFCVLASPNENVVRNAAIELNKHAEIMDLMKLPNSPQAKINIHVGGAYGNHEAALERFCSNFEKYLTPSAQSRLTVENDDKPAMYSTKMLYEGVHKRVGIPIVFDSHHHELGPQDQDYQDAFYLARSTWPQGVRQQCHHSNSKKLYEDPKVPAISHSSWYYTPFENFDEEVDVVLECKQKEMALFKYLKDFEPTITRLAG